MCSYTLYVYKQHTSTLQILTQYVYTCIRCLNVVPFIRMFEQNSIVLSSVVKHFRWLMMNCWPLYSDRERLLAMAYLHQTSLSSFKLVFVDRLCDICHVDLTASVMFLIDMNGEMAQSNEMANQ